MVPPKQEKPMKPPDFRFLDGKNGAQKGKNSIILLVLSREWGDHHESSIHNIS